MSDSRGLSIVVPTLGEAERLPGLLEDLRALQEDLRAPTGGPRPSSASGVPTAAPGRPGAEILVVDGGSTDDTVRIAHEAGARIVRSPAGRGAQLRAGAEAARGGWLFFVHADSRLDDAARTALVDFLDRADVHDFAHFDFRLERSDWIHRFIELGQELRERWLGLVYGDQGLVVSRPLYDAVSGYPEWPVMEDVGMVRRLAKRGRRVALRAALVTSSRRYDEEGGLRRWARNVMLMTLFQLGVRPEVLSRWYRPRGAARPPPAPPHHERVVGVFAKAPTPGRVKTRLAADLGAMRAAHVYRRMGRATVDALRAGPYRLIVFGDPPDPESLDEICEWLGPEGIEVRPQASGDLGARMHAALEEALADAHRALLVGTDIPDVDQRTVEVAFDTLADHDLVLGPATDGGYYLVGLTRPRPELFEGIPWSTPEVLPSTLERAARLDVTVGLLEAKADVDTVADLPVVLRAGIDVGSTDPA